MIEFIEILALCVITWFSACGLNHMSRKTHLLVVVSVVLLFSGAVARIWMLVTGVEQGDPGTAAILIAVATGMVAERRRSSNCPCMPSMPSSRHDRWLT